MNPFPLRRTRAGHHRAGLPASHARQRAEAGPPWGETLSMKQLQDCPLCHGHGLLRVEKSQRWWWHKLCTMRWLCEFWRQIVGANEP